MNHDAMSASPARPSGSASTAAPMPTASTNVERPRFATVCGFLVLAAAGVLLLAGTTTRTFTNGSIVYGTDGWVSWTTSVAVIVVVAVALSAATSLAPQGPARRPAEAVLQ